MFKSQNATTWTPSQFEDLKFTLYRAEFDISNTGTFAIVNEELKADSDLIIPARLGGGKESGIPTLDNDPVETKLSTAGVKVKFKDHAMYSTSNRVKITGVKSDVSPSQLNGAITSGQTGTVNVDDSSNWPLGSVTGRLGYVKIDDEILAYNLKPNSTSISISARAQQGTTAVAHEDNSIVELYMIGGIPLYEINKTHTALISVPELDSFQVTTTTTATSTVSSGGAGVQCTKNISMDVMQPVLQMMELPKTAVTGKLQTTTGTSVNGAQTSFTRTASASALDFPLDQDYYFDAPQIVCSKVNEDGATLAGNKSLRIVANMTSTSNTVSPMIDTKRMGVICISNKTNRINGAGDIGSFSNFHASTVAEGDPNKGIYMTKKVALSQGATAIKVLFDAVIMSESNIKVMYKTLRTDSAENFDDIEWTYFNTTGIPDEAVPISKTRYDFKEYSYFAGKNSLGVGTELPEYIAIAIKVIFQTTNSSLPPMIKDFRTIAFQA